MVLLDRELVSFYRLSIVTTLLFCSSLAEIFNAKFLPASVIYMH